jgi:phage baseplate assembly protein gpV
LREAVRYHAAALDATRPQPRFAVVESVDAARHLAKVTIQPEGVLTGWLPILGMGGGGAWGLICPPAVGAQVVVVPLDGDHENWAVLGAAWSTANVPPDPSATPGGAAAAVQAGEMALVSKAGAYVRLNADGSAVVLSPGNVTVSAGGNATIEATGTIALSAPSVVGGNGSLLQELCTAEAYTYLINHVHTDPQGGLTGAPYQAPPANPLTTNFKAS